MFSYKAFRRDNKAIRDKTRRQRYYEDEQKLLLIFKEDQMLNCWRFEKAYERLDGIALHQTWARGEGPIVRHLCSDGRCVNPLHIIRGTDLDNARDEIKVRDFENKVMMEILNDRSMENEDKALAHLTLLPKVSIKLVEERGYRTLRETNLYLRDMYRMEWTTKFIADNRDIDISDTSEKLQYLKNRNDIAIIEIPGR